MNQKALRPPAWRLHEERNLPQPNRDPQAIKAKMRAITQRNPAYRAMCDLVGELLLVTLKAEPKPETPQTDLRRRDALPSQGKSLWDMETLDLAWDRVWDLALVLAESLRDKPEAAQAVSDITELRRQAGGSAGPLRAILTCDALSLHQAIEGRQTPAQVLALVLRLALRPFLLARAQEDLPAAGAGSWSLGHCPVCGSAPGLAELSRPDGGRILHCSLCETAWPYPRLQCPFCEIAEPGNLGYVKTEGEEGMQAEYCAACGQYVKTLDLRELSGPVIAPLDDAATWHLDLIMQRRGKENS